MRKPVWRLVPLWRCSPACIAPSKWRTWAVRNHDAWYDAFAVQPQHKLYLPPEQRVKIWE